MLFCSFLSFWFRVCSFFGRGLGSVGARDQVHHRVGDAVPDVDARDLVLTVHPVIDGVPVTVPPAMSDSNVGLASPYALE